MKFSLKGLLISMCALGAILGLMSRLYIENPESFFNVLRAASTIGPWAFAIATIIYLGFRGTPPRRGLIGLGVILFLTPFVVNLAIALWLPTGNALQVLSTKRLIENRLSAQMDEPWIWQELERRLAAGDLSKSEVNEAIQNLAAYMRQKKPAGWNAPLSWQRDFIAPARQAGMISDQAFLTLCEAFYGTSPTVKLATSTIDTLTRDFQLQIDFGNPWADNSALDTQLLWEVKRVLAGDRPLTVKTNLKSQHNAFLTLMNDLPEGEHAIDVEVDCAIVDTSQLPTTVGGMDVGKLPSSQWPKARKRWTATSRATLTVAPAEK
jgi:hypothetical protein